MREIDHMDAARGLLNAMLLDPRSTPVVEGIVSSRDFPADEASSTSITGRLFSLLIEMHRSGESIRDGRLVISRVRAAGMIESFGGQSQFERDFLDPLSTENATHYARSLRNCSIRKRLQRLARDFSRKADSDNQDSGELAEWMRYELAAIESQASDKSHIHRIGDGCNELLAAIDETLAGGQSPGLHTGLYHLDDNYDGLHPGRLYVFAGRPGGGKSSAAQQVGENIVHGVGESIADRHRGALFVSLEMGIDEVTARFIARQSGINGKHILSHAVTEAERRQMQTVAEKSQSVPFFVSVPTGRQATAEAICAEARVMKATEDIAVVIVDYLQIVEDSTPNQREIDKTTRATRAFKQLSRELNIPVVILSQLNRAGESDSKNEKPREPRLSDLRSSGSIEQDADAVIFLHHEGGRNVRMIVAKMRGGERSENMFTFDGPTCSFHKPEPAPHEEFAEWSP
ncbi:Replicative DNA helicase [Rubripirellula lacrimiformis]|uniref:Replicative DNA helicase n=1 Tax=Rubripirellula lacrimiformis TaxID=1930273 RepID=A0A517NIL6_9BACT|nr:replicative DNA helicase [Rubripirellula lacrimiformis]QDT06893.1 Replicative DNA helicase [Rubripirellula lacrimiformis]